MTIAERADGLPEFALHPVGLPEQNGFFEPHDLKPPAPGDLRVLDEWAIDGLTDEECTAFMNALADLR